MVIPDEFYICMPVFPSKAGTPLKAMKRLPWNPPDEDVRRERSHPKSPQGKEEPSGKRKNQRGDFWIFPPTEGLYVRGRGGNQNASPNGTRVQDGGAPMGYHAPVRTCFAIANRVHGFCHFSSAILAFATGVL